MPLKTVNLTIGYSRLPLMSGINVGLGKDSLTVLIGSNGCGKSTLLRTLSGSQPSLSGSVEIDGKNIGSYTSALLAKKLSIVLTDRSGSGGLLVRELVAIGRNPYSGFFGNLSRADVAIVSDALDAVGLAHKADCYVARLSDGERQKAMIARAIAQSTDIIILDEPTSFLDVASRFEIMNLLATLAHDHHKSILLSTHDTGASLPVADCVWAVADNQLHAGTVDSLRDVLDHVFPSMRFDAVRSDFIPDVRSSRESGARR